MQSQDDNGNIVSTVPVDPSDLSDLRKKIEKAQNAGAILHTIAGMPVRGQRFVLGGLTYEVKSTNVKDGIVTIKLVGT